MSGTLRAWVMGSLLAVSLAFGSALAGPKDGGNFGMPPLFRPEVLDHVAEEIQLDAATHKKLEDMAYQAEKDITRAEAEVKVQRMELRRLLEQDAPDERDVVRQLEALNKLEYEVRKSRLTTLLKMRAMLTPEQRKKVKVMHEQYMEQRGEGRGNGHRSGKRGGMGKEGSGMRGPGGPGGPMGGGPGDEL